MLRIFYMTLLIFLIASSLLIFFPPVISASQTADTAEDKVKPISLPLRYTFDGRQYKQSQLIVDFIQSAYSRSMWFDDPLNRQVGFLTPAWYSREKNPMLNNYPEWLVEYVLREKGHPAFDAINRWPGEITIGIGWPPPSKVKEDTKGFSDRARKQIEHITGQLQSASGRSVTYIPPVSETETNFARIRIIDGGTDKFFHDNKFKIRRDEQPPIPVPIAGTPSQPFDVGKHGFMPRLEGLFRDAVRFTPFSRSQVEGYFVSDNKNNLSFSVCYIWPHHKDDLFNALITECLMRAMGLPEMPMSKNISAIGNWNTAHDPHSKRFVLDQGKANYASMFKKEDQSPALFQHDLTQHAPQDLTEYDNAMISLLYCDALSPGQARYDAIDIFLSGDMCFKNFKPVRLP